jgi:hypothetical protein
MAHTSYAQNLNPTRSQLLNLFEKSIQQDKNGKVLIGSNPWIACNKDSSFFTSDTISLYNNSEYSQQECCDFIEWTFYKRKEFVINRTQNCKEPATGTVPNLTDWFSIHFIKDKKNLIFEIVNQNKPTNRFKVISIDKIFHAGKPDATTNIIILVRQAHVTNKESSLESTI